MDPDAVKTTVMAALGQPFSLGMLYDCHRNSLIPAISLWDREDLSKHIGERPQYYSDFEIVASESSEDKYSALNVDESLKASLLFGLIELGGSAKYLNNNLTSKNQARVTLKYEATTKFQELSMNHLAAAKVQHPDIFKKGVATHVVTAILYGAQAFFVFDRDVSEGEDYQEVQGNMKSMIKRIPLIDTKYESSLKLEDKNITHDEKFTCEFHGDFCLEKNPVSFQDAVHVYQSLPKLLGANRENVVALKVWLLPLTCLDPSATTFVHQIRTELVHKAQRVLEDFTELEMRCNDAMKTTIAQQFPEIKKNLNTFKKLCFDFKVEFQRTLAKKLPLVRGGDEEESVLAEILEQRHTSFNNMNLNEWMDCIEEEIYTLMSFTNKMKNTKIIPSENDLYKEVHRAKHTVCFVFTLKKGAVPYLSVLTNYLKEPAEPYHVEEAAEKPQWFSTKEVLEPMRHKAKLFIDFAEANKENNNIQFLTVSLANENTETKGTSIYHYEDGKLVNKDFEPPAEPEIESGVTHNSVTLSIRPPRFGAENITCYSVEYYVSGEDEWRQRRASRAGEVTVSGLTPNTEYMFRCRAECSAGVGPAKEICDCIKTLPTSPPINLLVESTSRKISVAWERPVEVGPGVHSLSYIVEYTKTDKKVKCDDLHWNQMVSSVESAEIDGLEPGTDYAVRVRCECGVDGRSGESRSVDVCTKKCTHLIELLKCTSKCINSESPSVYKLPLTEEDVGIAGCRMYRFGKENMGQNRTIILLGETGSGKSTLINAMINHIVGVEWSDSFRFRITDEAQLRSHTENRTSEVTVYKINHQDGFTIPFSLMVVDTPGFMSTRGIETDKEIKEQIDRLFTSVDGVSEVDAVCFVTPASISCITPIQKYTFDSMLSIFGKDVAENIMVLVTFADGKHPPVIEAMKALGVNCPQMEDNPSIHFKFNNSALFEVRNSSAANNTTADDADENESLNEMFWSMVTKSMRRFFVTLNVSNTKSLTQTKEVLRVRSQLEHSEENLLTQFKLGLAIHERIKKKAELLEDYEAEITRTENFEFEFLVKKIVQNDISLTGHYITNCKECQHTCHYPCSIQKDEEKNGCSAIGSDGHCTKCPGKCKWTVHVNQSYRWEYGEVREKQTVPELKEKYENATEAKTAIQTQIEELLTEYESVQDEVMKQMETSDKCLNRLKEIALKPNPLSTPGYIDMLIEGEKSEAKPGWRERVHSLIVMREKAEHIAKFLPLQTEQESHNILF